MCLSWKVNWPAPKTWFWNSGEILAPQILKIASPASGAKLHCLKLYETPRNFVEYYGE